MRHWLALTPTLCLDSLNRLLGRRYANGTPDERESLPSLGEGAGE
jgi:hypothetical protein